MTQIVRGGWVMRESFAMPLWLVVVSMLSGAPPSACEERPSGGPSRSVGGPSRGSLEGGVALDDSEDARVLPKRHKARCLQYGVLRLVAALARAGHAVREKHGGGALGVGDLSRARGGPISYSHSHQAGRDVDLAFYAVSESGAPLTVDDLWRPGEGDRRFDVVRMWALVAALLEDREIDVRWLFISEELKAKLLAEGARQKASKAVLARAGEVLHQPSDAPPHDDHLHLRIRCTAGERDQGCRD